MSYDLGSVPFYPLNALTILISYPTPQSHPLPLINPTSNLSSILTIPRQSPVLFQHKPMNLHPRPSFQPSIGQIAPSSARPALAQIHQQDRILPIRIQQTCTKPIHPSIFSTTLNPSDSSIATKHFISRASRFAM